MKRGDHILITGAPGAGKTTLFQRLVDELRNLNPVGFYTAEIRKGGTRQGFSLCGLNGRTAILAHVEFRTGFRVGKYDVDVGGFEAFLNGLSLMDPQTGPVMIDEIGRMECLSDPFTETIRDILNGEKQLIATIAQKGGGLIAELKTRSDVQLFRLTRENQEFLINKIRALLL